VILLSIGTGINIDNIVDLLDFDCPWHAGSRLQPRPEPDLDPNPTREPEPDPMKKIFVLFFALLWSGNFKSFANSYFLDKEMFECNLNNEPFKVITLL
jgi:hypothetical protein